MMIVVPENDIAQSKALEATQGSVAHHDEPPPYTLPSAQPANTATTSSSTQPAPQPRPKPTNFVYLSRDNSAIRGAFTIDPFLIIPPAFLPPLSVGQTEQDRKNLTLLSRNGAVDAQIWLATDSVNEERIQVEKMRAKLDLSSHNGSVTATVRTAASAPIPFSLTVRAHNGNIYINIPRTFHGPLTASTQNGSVLFSDGLEPHVRTFSEVKSKRFCFVGDFSEWTGEEGSWRGDEMEIDSKNGKIRIRYVDEISKPDGKGFFSRVFGL